MMTTEQKQQTMILAKMPPADNPLKHGAIKIGACVHTPGMGWKFIPNNAAHKPSRKFHETCNKCIPKWAFGLADEMFTATEWMQRKTLCKPRLQR